MDPVTLTLAGLTSAATVLSVMLVARSLFGQADPWGINPWGTDVIVDDTIKHSPTVQTNRPKPTTTGSWMRKNRRTRTRNIVTNVLHSDRIIPRMAAFDAPPPPGTY
jgi:hypothetical protein